MSDKKYRILRIIEYTGEHEWIAEQINKRMVKGTYHIPNGRGVIREAIIGETPEVVDPDEDYNRRFAESLEKGDSA